MDYTQLGKTGLRVSVLGLGAGGHSRLGMQTGVAREDSLEIIRHALAAGVNFFDTAEIYGTEELVGEGLRSSERSQIVLSSKKTIKYDGRLISGDELIAGLEASLKRLQTDYLDIYHLHGVRNQDYDYALDELVPALQKLREQGKIRFLGITEAFGFDTTHSMLSRAVQSDLWEVVMVGFNILNQSARQLVLHETQARQIGVLCMFAVRDALNSPENLRKVIDSLLASGELSPEIIDVDNPLGFVLEAAQSIPDAAYRFCRAEPGIDVVLSGTGRVAHLQQNIESIGRPALPAEVHAKLVEIFGKIDSVSGNT